MPTATFTGSGKRKNAYILRNTASWCGHLLLVSSLTDSLSCSYLRIFTSHYVAKWEIRGAILRQAYVFAWSRTSMYAPVAKSAPSLSCSYLRIFTSHGRNWVKIPHFYFAICNGVGNSWRDTASWCGCLLLVSFLADFASCSHLRVFTSHGRNWVKIPHFYFARAKRGWNSKKRQIIFRR